MTDAPQEIRDNYEEVMPGVFAGVPNDVYHASEGISKTNICDINRSVAHFLLSKRHPIKQTDPMLKGSALHDICLLPEFYASHYKVSPTKGKNTKGYKDFCAKYPDNSILTPGMVYDVKEMRDSLFNNPTIKHVLQSKSTLREVSIWAIDPVTGLLLKIRPDIIHDGIIFDIKTTVSPNPGGFLHSVYDYKYHVQSAYYQYVSSLIGMSIDNFVFLVVGSKPPYLTGIYDLNTELEESGEEFFRESLKTYSNYLNSDDKWDGLVDGRELVTL